MTEEMIIDGVNVAGCEHHLSTGYCQLQMIFQGMVLKLPFGKHLECNLCDKDCYYKQLKRLEQENKELEKNQCHFSTCEHIDAEIARYAKLSESFLNYRSALEEIRVMLVKLNTNDEDDFTYEFSKIEDKINEVLEC